MESYKGYLLFKDRHADNLIGIKKQYNSTGEQPVIHTSTMCEARDSVDELSLLHQYMDWYRNKYGTLVMMNDKLIVDFVTGV